MGGPLGSLMEGDVRTFVYLIVAYLLSITVHEAGHALAAFWLGDRTREQRQRISLNPLRHLDPWGSMIFLFTGFGWAKPVMVNPLSLRGDPIRSMGLVAFAGPLANLTLGAIAATYINLRLGGPAEIRMLFVYLLFINVGLAVFNLLPLPILDGYKVLQSLLPRASAYSMSIFEAKWGIGILATLMALSFFDLPMIGRLNIFSMVLQPMTEVVRNALLLRPLV